MIAITGAIDDIAPDQMQKLMDVNYTGTYHATRAALPWFRRTDRVVKRFGRKPVRGEQR